MSMYEPKTISEYRPSGGTVLASARLYALGIAKICGIIAMIPLVVALLVAAAIGSVFEIILHGIVVGPVLLGCRGTQLAPRWARWAHFQHQALWDGHFASLHKQRYVDSLVREWHEEYS